MAEDTFFDEVNFEVESDEVIDTSLIDLDAAEEKTVVDSDVSEKTPEPKGGKAPDEFKDLIDLDEIEKLESSKKEEINKEEIEDTTEDKKTPDSPADNSSPSAAYIVFGNMLKSKGSFSSFDEETFKKAVEDEGKDPDEVFTEMQTKELERAKQEYIDGLSDEDRELYEAKHSGVQLDKLGQINKALNTYESIDPEAMDDETSKAIIKADLKQRGFDDEDIVGQLEYLEENDKLQTQAVKSRNRFIDGLKEQKQFEIDNAAKAKQDRVAKIELEKQEVQSYINGLDEIIPGIKLDKNTKDQIYKDLTTPAAKDDAGNPVDVVTVTRSKNPKAFDAALRYYHRAGFFNIDEKGQFKPDFSKIMKKVSTKQTKTLKDVLDTTGFKSSGKSKSSTKHTGSIFEDME